MIELTPPAAWKAYWDEGKSFPECAQLFGVSVGTLVNRFAEWRFPTRSTGPRRGSKGTKAVLTDDQVQYILDTAGKISLRSLEKELGVSHQRISQIRNGQHRPLNGVDE